MTSEIKEAQAVKKEFDFYQKAKMQYNSSAKPFNYEFHLQSKAPKPRKFFIMINKFVEIFKLGLKKQHQDEDELHENYWNQLQNYFPNGIEMKYMMTIYEKKFLKLRIYFVILLHTKNIFKKLKEIIQNMSFLYQKPQERLKNFQKDIQLLSFLRDGQYEIDSLYVDDYNKFKEQVKQKQLIQKKRKQDEQRTQRQLLQRQQERLNKIKQDEQNEIILRNKKLRLEEQKRIEKNKQALEAQNNKKIQPEKSDPEKKEIKTIGVKIPNTKSTDQRQETPYETRGENIKPKYMKNSQYFLQHLEQQAKLFNFRQGIKPSVEKAICFECKRPLSEGFYFLGGNINYCYYTGEWYCNECIAEERIPIPQKAKEEFDLRGYSVCKRALEEIKSLYEKAIIEINVFNQEDNKMMKQNRKLYQFLILKRQIHLMYDSICNPSLMQKLFAKRLNYCLKRNLLSLKNLKDIYNGYEIPSIENQYNILVKHFYKCQACQTRKGYICAKCNHPPKIFAFELKETFSCKNCQKIYHRRCLMNGKCPCEDY